MNQHLPSPLFSIVTITWNAQETLEPTLASVANQTFRNFEYVVIDGASTDNTLAMLAAYPNLVTTLVSEPDKGLYDAMNKGIAAARGTYLIFLNAGDALFSTTTLADTAAQLEAAESLPDILYGETALVDAARNFLAMRRLQAPEKLSWRSFAQGMLVCHQSFWVKRSLGNTYDCRYRLSADFDWCIRSMKQATSIHNTHLTLINYLNEGVTTRHRKASLRERYHIMVQYYGAIPTLLRHLWFALRFGVSRIRGID